MNQEFNNENEKSLENTQQNNNQNVSVQQTPVEPINNQPVMQQLPVEPINNQLVMQQVPVENDKKSKSKKWVFFGVGLAAIIVIIGILLIFGLLNNDSPKKIVEKYITNILEKEYSENYSLILLPENNFVETNDYIEYVQKQQKYTGLAEMNIEAIEEVLISEENAKYNVTLKDKNNLMKNVSIELNKQEKWKVVEDNLYVENWSMIVPKGTKMFINNVEVPNSLIVEDLTITKTDIKYVIPAIAMTKKEIVLDNPLQKKTIELTPLASNSGEKYTLELTNSKLVSKAYDYIKTTWNEMYKDYLNNVNVSDIAKKYFVTTMDINNINTYYKNGFDSITKGSSGYKYVNYNMLEVINSKYSNYVISDDIITINFGYKITWNWTFSMASELRTMTRYSKIRLKLDGDTFKIYEVPDEKLFSYSNQFTKEY